MSLRKPLHTPPRERAPSKFPMSNPDSRPAVFEKWNTVVRHNQSNIWSLAEALYEIKSLELFREAGFTCFSNYCTSNGISLRLSQELRRLWRTRERIQAIATEAGQTQDWQQIWSRCGPVVFEQFLRKNEKVWRKQWQEVTRVFKAAPPESGTIEARLTRAWESLPAFHADKRNRINTVSLQKAAFTELANTIRANVPEGASRQRIMSTLNRAMLTLSWFDPTKPFAV